MENFYVFKKKEEWIAMTDEKPFFCFHNPKRKLAVAELRLAVAKHNSLREVAQ